MSKKETKEKLEKQIKKLQRENKRLEYEAYTDPLTGLLNRRAKDDYLKMTVENHKKITSRSSKKAIRFDRRDDTQMGILALDIDFFKQINDLFGHYMGDRVLVEASKLLKESVETSFKRKVDRINRQAVFRTGGEEFEVIIKGTSPEGLRILAERIREAFEKKLIRKFPSLRKKRKKITASIGGACLDLNHHYSTDYNLKKIQLAEIEADENAYRAKRKGRNQIVIS